MQIHSLFNDGGGRGGRKREDNNWPKELYIWKKLSLRIVIVILIISVISVKEKFLVLRTKNYYSAEIDVATIMYL